MHSWTSEQWTAIIVGVIGAVSAAITSIIGAIQNKGLAKKADDNHAETLAAVQSVKETP